MKMRIKRKIGEYMFNWSKEFEVGNAQIDKEHKELFEAINQLLLACKGGKGRAEVENTIQFLENYVKTHFAHEEAIQKKYNYPDYIAHKKLHTDFMKKVQIIAKKLRQDGATVGLVGEINMDIGMWLGGHIKTEDKKLGLFLQGKQ